MHSICPVRLPRIRSPDSRYAIHGQARVVVAESGFGVGDDRTRSCAALRIQGSLFLIGTQPLHHANLDAFLQQGCSHLTNFICQNRMHQLQSGFRMWAHNPPPVFPERYTLFGGHARALVCYLAGTRLRFTMVKAVSPELYRLPRSEEHTSELQSP